MTQSRNTKKDKFETLCYIKANISSAPLTTNRIAPGRMGYKRQYDIVLLVGLTELKAQLSWIDSRTVCAHIVLHVYPHLTRLSCARV